MGFAFKSHEKERERKRYRIRVQSWGMARNLSPDRPSDRQCKVREPLPRVLHLPPRCFRGRLFEESRRKTAKQKKKMRLNYGFFFVAGRCVAAANLASTEESNAAGWNGPSKTPNSISEERRIRSERRERPCKEQDAVPRFEHNRGREELNPKSSAPKPWARPVRVPSLRARFSGPPTPSGRWRRAPRPA